MSEPQSLRKPHSGGRKSARDVLEAMMRDLGENDWPSEATWRDACKIVGWPTPKPFPTSESTVSVLEAAVGENKQFKP